jgi:hypothetical protein
MGQGSWQVAHQGYEVGEEGHETGPGQAGHVLRHMWGVGIEVLGF